jgi:MoaA/NifB/PqqE/SkfB family radical SAM enzyme
MKQITKTRTLVKNNQSSELLVINKPPSLVEINLHNMCNFKCKMCYFWKLKDKQIMPYEKLIEIIKNISKFNNNNKIIIQFMGGETLMYPELDKAIKYANSFGFETGLVTNGSFLSKEYIEKLSYSGLSYISISLDSMDESVHNFMRGHPTSFKMIMKALDYIEEFAPNIVVGINTLITAVNIHGLKQLSSWVKDKKIVKRLYFSILDRPLTTNLGPDWRENTKFSYLWPHDKKVVNDAFNMLEKEIKINPKISNSINQLTDQRRYFLNPHDFIKQFGCIYGDFQVHIDPNSNVRLCTIIEDEFWIGNLKQDSIVDLWYSKKAQEIRKKMIECKINCIHILGCRYDSEI